MTEPGNCPESSTVSSTVSRQATGHSVFTGDFHLQETNIGLSMTSLLEFINIAAERGRGSCSDGVLAPMLELLAQNAIRASRRSV